MKRLLQLRQQIVSSIIWSDYKNTRKYCRPRVVGQMIMPLDLRAEPTGKAGKASFRELLSYNN